MATTEELEQQIEELRARLDAVSKGGELKMKSHGFRIGNLRIFQREVTSGDDRLYQEEPDGTQTDLTTAGSGGTRIQDADADTKVQTEKTTDDDTVRFDCGGTETATIDATNKLKVDAVNEYTGAAGVTVDGSLIKDSGFYPDSGDANMKFAKLGSALYFLASAAEGIIGNVAAHTWSFATNSVTRFQVADTGVGVTGNITVTGTVDGVDIAGRDHAQAHAADHTDGTDDIQDAAADDSTKGIATFEADDFDDSSGKIDLAVSVTKASTTDSGTATPTAHDLSIVGGEGIDTSASGATVTIAGEAASTTNKGVVELAINTEINTGTSTVLANTPDALAGSNFGIRYMQAVVYDFTTDCAVAATGKFWMHIPPGLTGMNLVYCHAEVITAGVSGNGAETMDIEIYNLTDTVDMLSTTLTVDATETGSDTAATPYVIDGGNDDVATNDVIRIDIDAVHTTPAKGLIVTLGFQLP